MAPKSDILTMVWEGHRPFFLKARGAITLQLEQNKATTTYAENGIGDLASTESLTAFRPARPPVL